MNELLWLVWSNEHRAWWRPGGWGYTGTIEQAGRYLKHQADAICTNANYGGQVNEVAVLSPESTAALIAGNDA